MQYVKNGYRKKEIELLRLWCTLAVCLHHLRYCSESLPYGGGYIAVDFFFLLSGFYLRKAFIVEKDSGEVSAFRYVVKRYIRLFKDYILAFVLALILSIIYFDIKPSIYWGKYIKEALMIEIECIDISLRINPADWYCGYLLISSWLIYLLLKTVRKGVGIYSIIIAGYVFCFLWEKYGHINIFPMNSGFLSEAILRAVAGQLLGVFIYEMVMLTNGHAIVHQKFLKGVYIVLFVIISYMLFWDTAYGMSDYICIILFGVLVYISQYVEFQVLDNINAKKWGTFSELTYVLFLNHYIVVKLLGYYNVFQYIDWKIVSIIFIITAFLLAYVMLRIRVVIEKLLKIFCKIVIINENY